MTTRLPIRAATLAAAVSLVAALSGAAEAAVLYSGLLARGTGNVRCSLTNLGDQDLEVESILVRDASNTPVSATSNNTLGAGETLTHATTVPNEGRCVFTFKGGKSKVRGVICIAPSANAACTVALPAN